MKLRRAAHVAWRRVGDETVLIHLKQKRMYVLNPSGGFFWDSLDGSTDCEQMLSGLAESESPLPADAVGELSSFMETLRAADLVEATFDGTETERENEAGEEDEAALARPVLSSGFVPPALVWQEEIRNFGQSCGFQQGGPDPLCTQVPTM